MCLCIEASKRLLRAFIAVVLLILAENLKLIKLEMRSTRTCVSENVCLSLCVCVFLNFFFCLFYLFELLFDEFEFEKKRRILFYVLFAIGR